MKKPNWKKIKDLFCKNIVLKVASVILAFTLWLLVINIDDPQTTATVKNIPVTILNEDVITGNEESYDILSGSTVDVKITGPRTIVDSLKKGDFTATADFEELSKTNAVPIVVSLNNSRYETKVTIGDKSENTMRLSIEKLAEKEYTIKTVYSNGPASGYVVYSTVPETEIVTVKAPESVHNNISKALLMFTLSGNETEDFDYSGSVVLYDNDNKPLDKEKNHITLSSMYIKVHGTVYYKKVVDVKYNVVDRLSTGRIMTEYNSSVKSVDIVGKKEILDTIDEINIPESLTIVTDDSTEISVDLNDILPDGVYVYGSDGTIKITATTEEIVNKTISIKADDIGIKKIPDGYEGSVTSGGTIDLTISGRKEVLEDIDTEKLAPYVDLTNGTEGDNTVKVNVVLPEDAKLVSNVLVTVTLTSKEKNTKETQTDNTRETTTAEEKISETKQTETSASDENNTTSESETTTPATSDGIEN